MATTARQRLSAGFTTMMTAYIAANPTLLVRHFRVKPESMNTDMPFSYLDLRPETVTYDVGVQRRVLSPSLVVVDRYTESGETSDTFDVVVDSLVEFLGGYGGSFGGHITNDSTWSTLTITDFTEAEGESYFPAVRFTFGDILFAEGR